VNTLDGVRTLYITLYITYSTAGGSYPAQLVAAIHAIHYMQHSWCRLFNTYCTIQHILYYTTYTILYNVYYTIQGILYYTMYTILYNLYYAMLYNVPYMALACLSVQCSAVQWEEHSVQHTHLPPETIPLLLHNMSPGLWCSGVTETWWWVGRW
jgi:hypothetical protein